MGEREMEKIAGFIRDALQCRKDTKKLASFKDDVISLAKQFPLYRHRLQED
jgi:glycine/serine hydroxymethyltransferase